MSDHTCPGGCGAPVPRHHFACRDCWFRLPLEMRRAISGNYRRDPGAHLEAMLEAMDFYQQNPITVRGGDQA